MKKPAEPPPAPPPRPVDSYSAEELEAIAARCDERRADGLNISPASVALFAEGLRALARERSKG
jgi:hypothetical protein